MATFDANISSFGIVDTIDPQFALPGSLRPFSVGPADNLLLVVRPGTVVFKSGEIVLIENPITGVELDDPTPGVRNIVYLQFEEQEFDPSITRQLAPINTRVDYLADPSGYLKVSTKADYDLLSQLEKDNTIPLALVTTQTVAASGGGTTLQLIIDQSQTSLASNRPWFSVADISHRSHTGSGIVTNRNIHGLSFNDLSAAGDLTMLQIQLDHGMIVAKDRALPGVPGTICSETISAQSISTDTNGSVTGVVNARYFRLSRYPRIVHRVEMGVKASGSITVPDGTALVDGETFTLHDGIGAPVVFEFDSDNSVEESETLRQVSFSAGDSVTMIRNAIAVAINGSALAITATTPLANQVTLVNDSVGAAGNTVIGDTVVSGYFSVVGMDGGIQRELAPFVAPGTNLVSLLTADEFVTKGQTNLTVTYSVVDAAELPTNNLLTSVRLRTPITNEVIISGGLFQQGLRGGDLTFEDVGTIPSSYVAYINSFGTLQKFPQVVYCQRKLADIGTALQSFDRELLGPARLKVFLADSAAGPNLNVQVQISGTNEDGDIQTETIKFDSSWSGSPAPFPSENPAQYKLTNTIFDTVSNLIVSWRENDAANSSIMVQAALDSVSTRELADGLPVADVHWDGLRISSMRDIRPINTCMEPIDYTPIIAAAQSIAETTQVLTAAADNVFQYWAEDFERPRMITTTVTDTSTAMGLAESSTTVNKLMPGAGHGNMYISRPMPVKPYTGQPLSMRFVPLNPGPEFTLKVRYYLGGAINAWQPWVTTFTTPYHSVNLSSAVHQIVKWQMVTTGYCQGMVVVFLKDTTATDTSFIKNLGGWTNGVLV